MNKNRIIAILLQLRRLFRKHCVVGFLADVEDLLRESTQQPKTFVEKVDDNFFRYGGMGSPSDLYISTQNGNTVQREKEANYEVQALFNVLNHLVRPPKDPTQGMKHFWTFPTTRAEWEVKLTSGEVEAIFDVLVFITYYHADWRWVQGWCLHFTYHSNQDLRALAARCMADLAKLHKQIDIGIVLTRLGELMTDEEQEVRESAAAAVESINSAINIVS